MELNKEALVKEIVATTTEEAARYIASAIESAVNVAQYEVLTLKEELQRAQAELAWAKSARKDRAERDARNAMFAKLIKTED